jgi:hypothetical protein
VVRKSIDWSLSAFETELIEYNAGILLVKVVLGFMVTGLTERDVLGLLYRVLSTASYAVYLVSFTILSIYLTHAPVSAVMSAAGQFSPTGWAITRTIEGFNNAGVLSSLLPVGLES